MAVNTIPCRRCPRDDDGPVFREPWEAHAFALAVRLSEANCFTWSEWAATLSHEIQDAQERGDPDLGSTYYHHWVRALERLCVEKGLAKPHGGTDADARVARCVPPHPARPTGRVV